LTDTSERKRNAWMTGAAEDWATESLLAARAASQVPGTDKRMKSGQKLGEGVSGPSPAGRKAVASSGRDEVGVGVE
jgi:hypothetical protein